MVLRKIVSRVPCVDGAPIGALRSILLASASAWVVSAAIPSVVHAQSTIQLDPIAVEGQGQPEVQGYVAKRGTTATKTNTPVHETPQAISVVTGEQIRDQKPMKLDEVVRYAPGVLGATYGSDSRNDWFLIRGFPAQNESVFLDGLQLFYTSYSSWKLHPFALDRLEVVRGPNSVLFGGASPGGLINAISKRPTTEPLRYIEAGINNFGNRYVGFDLGGPVAIQSEYGQFLYRLTGMAKAGDTQVDFTKDDSYFIAPALTWRPNANTSFTVLSQLGQNTTNGQNFLPYVGTAVAAPFGRISTSLFASEPSMDLFRRNQQMIGYQFEHSFSNNVTFRQNARYAHVDVRYSTMFGLGYVGGDPAAGAATLARGNFLTTADASQWAMDNQLEVKFGTGPLSHTMLFGVDLKRFAIDDYQGFGGGPPINVVSPVYTPSTPFTGAPFQNALLTQGQAGFYVQDQIKLDRLTLVLGGRHDHVSVNNESRTATGDYQGNSSKFTGRAAAIYNFDFGLAPYVSYATGFNPVIGRNSVTGQPLTPETSEQVEVGVKYLVPGLNAQFGVALFDLTRANVLTTDPTNPLLSTQTGEVNSRGIELEAVLNPMKGLKIVGAYTAYDIKVTNDRNTALIGKDPTATPETIASLWFDYTLQSGPLQGFGFGGGIRHVGPSFADNVNTMPVSAYTLGDAAIHYERDGWRFALNVANVTDEVYVGSCASAASCFYGDRRRATLSASKKW